jgi:putative chitinase
MNHIINFQQNNGLVPDGKLGKMTIGKMKDLWGLNNAQISNLLGQVYVESQEFTKSSENLNYSAERLLLIFKNDFDTNKDRVLSEVEKRLALLLAHKPKDIANFVYANQNGNGDVTSGDGWKHRGFGAIQLTGKRNQYAFADWIKDQKIKTNPEIIANKYFWETAIFYFAVNNLFDLAKGVDSESIKKLTKAINGGYNHLKEREEATKKYYRMLTQ